MAYKDTIAKLIEETLSAAEIDTSGLGALSEMLTVPKDRKMGDFAFPCFRLAKAMRKAPPMIANELLPGLTKRVAACDDLSEVVAAGPYLNFRVNKAALAASLIPAVRNGSFLAPREAVNEKVMIEYSQPNTHKAFHVGHTRNVALGDALVRIFEWSGHEVVASNYIGDEGTHIAKCLWYYRNHFNGEVPDTNLGEFLGDLYAHASIMLDFKTLTKCPMPGVIIGRVTEIAPIEGQEKVKRVVVDGGDGTFQVICGGVDYAEGDLVAYARVGSRVGGRQLGEVEKYGVLSAGMILSEKELGLTDNKETIYTFDSKAVLGQEVAEHFRVPGALPEDRSVLAEMKERTDGVAHTLKLLEAKDPEIDGLWQETKKWSMDEFYSIYNWLGARFDHYFYESEVGDKGKQICLDYFDKGVLVRSEGAIGANLDDVGLPFLLLIKSDGSGLYATKDIALAKEKFDGWGIDRSVYVVDASQSLHFQQVFKTLGKMGYKRAENCYHLAYGMVKLPSGKMGSRHGNVILLSQLRDMLDKQIRENYPESFVGTEEENAEVSRRISVATIRYGMNNQDNGKDIIFDLKEWAGRTGNTGPYILYAFARTRSLLRRAAEEGAHTEHADWGKLTHELEEGLLNLMTEFPKTVDRAKREYRPQLVCIYLFDLAKAYNRFYDNCPILKAEDKGLQAARLHLADAAGLVIQKGLHLLGIETLDRM